MGNNKNKLGDPMRKQSAKSRKWDFFFFLKVGLSIAYMTFFFFSLTNQCHSKGKKEKEGKRKGQIGVLLE